MKKLSIFILFPFLLIVSSQHQAGFIALGDGQSHNWDYKIKCFPWSKFDILYLSASNINSDGSVGLRFDNDAQHIPQVVNSAHQNNVKVLLSIGGPSGFDAFRFDNAIKNPQNFIKSLESLQKKFNLDGFDLDWEADPNDESIMVISNAFRSSSISNYMLSLDVYDYLGLKATTLKSFDFINVMNYGSGNSLVNEDIDSSAMKFSGAVNPSKLLIGVNFEAYGDDSQENTGVTQQLNSVIANYKKNNAAGIFSWNSFDDSGAQNRGCVWAGTETIYKKLKN